MNKLFEHVSKYHRTTETLSVKECGQGLYVGVYSCEIIPSKRVGELNYDEQTTSIVVPLEKVRELANSLIKVVGNPTPNTEYAACPHCQKLLDCMFDGGDTYNSGDRIQCICPNCNEYVYVDAQVSFRFTLANDQESEE